MFIAKPVAVIKALDSAMELRTFGHQIAEWRKLKKEPYFWDAQRPNINVAA